MTIDKIILFIVFWISYSIALKKFKGIGFKLKQQIRSRVLRVGLVLAVFCMAVFFQANFTDSESITIRTAVNAVFHGICLGFLTHLLWGKKLAE